jgi:hypothetical protein
MDKQAEPNMLDRAQEWASPHWESAQERLTGARSKLQELMQDPNWSLPLLAAGGAGLAGGVLSSRTPRRYGETRAQRRWRMLRDAVLSAGAGAGAVALAQYGRDQFAGSGGTEEPPPEGGGLLDRVPGPVKDVTTGTTEFTKENPYLAGGLGVMGGMGAKALGAKTLAAAGTLGMGAGAAGAVGAGAGRLYVNQMRDQTGIDVDKLVQGFSEPAWDDWYQAKAQGAPAWKRLGSFAQSPGRAAARGINRMVGSGIGRAIGTRN